MKINFNGTNGKINFNGTGGVIHFGDPNRYVNPTVVMYQIYVSAGNYTTIARVTDHNQTGTLNLLCEDVNPPVEEYQITAGGTVEVPFYDPETGVVTVYSQIGAGAKTASEIIQTSYTLVTTNTVAPTVSIGSAIFDDSEVNPLDWYWYANITFTNGDSFPVKFKYGVAVAYNSQPAYPTPSSTTVSVEPGASLIVGAIIKSDAAAPTNYKMSVSAISMAQNIAGTQAKATSSQVNTPKSF